MKNKDTKTYRLCYVEGDEYTRLKLWFTDDFENQWGDDWNDKPYEHNAGEPYDHYFTEHEEIPIKHKCCYVECGAYIDISTPNKNFDNSPYSVEEINHRVTPWLIISDKDAKQTYIFARDTYHSVLKKLKDFGCVIYTPIENKKKEE